MYNCYEMFDVVIQDGKVWGIIVCNLFMGEFECYVVYCVVLAFGGYGNVFYLFINVMNFNGIVVWCVVCCGVYMVNFCFM